MKNMLMIALFTFALVGCGERVVKKDVSYKPPRLADGESVLVLNPNAENKITLKELGQHHDGTYFTLDGSIEIDHDNGKYFVLSVLIHEFGHHLEFMAAEEEWTFEERVKLGKLLEQCMRDYNDSRSGFEIITHESYLHFMTTINDDEEKWWIEQSFQENMNQLESHKGCDCGHH